MVWMVWMVWSGLVVLQSQRDTSMKTRQSDGHGCKNDGQMKCGLPRRICCRPLIGLCWVGWVGGWRGGEVER